MEHRFADHKMLAIAIGVAVALAMMFVFYPRSPSLEPQVVVPDVAGLEQDVARNTLFEAGFKVSIMREPSSAVSMSVQPNQATRTDPPAGTKTADGTVITVFISTGSH